MTPFAERLNLAIRLKKTPALVGLDPRWNRLPDSLRQSAIEQGGDWGTIHARAYTEFCLRIIDIVAPLVPAVKPQAAFFEACGPAGVEALRTVIAAARKAGLIVICDAKRGDIGTTAEAYAAAYLAGEDPDAAPFAADCLTVNPYMGIDTLQPFVNRCVDVGAGIYVLVRTSNPGAGDFQDRQTDGLRLFENVADRIEELSHQTAAGAAYGAVGAVVGATYPAELGELRQRMPHVPLLIPGYGSQGGTSADVAAGFDAAGLGALVNSSRGIIFAYQSGRFAQQFGEAQWESAVQAATYQMIEDLNTHTPAANLGTA